MGAFEYVEPSSCAPRASFFPDQREGSDPLTVFFDASSSGASQYGGVIFEWDFGDGIIQSSNGSTISHTYNYGIFTVSLLVSTDCGSHRLILDHLIKVRGSFYQDADNDGFGDPNVAATGYEIPEGFADNAEDCQDADSNILTILGPSCIPYNSYEFLLDHKILNIPIWFFQYKESNFGPSHPTYWFFGLVAGEKLSLPQGPPEYAPGPEVPDLYIIDR